MDWTPDPPAPSDPVYVIIPARNEVATVAEIVRAVQSQPGWLAVVVDDASDDATGREAQQAGATVLRLPMSLGAWGAIQTGMRYVHGQAARYVVTMDADGQHVASEIERLLGPLRSGQAEVVIGSCPARVSQGRTWVWRFFRTLTGLAIEDITSGFRAYSPRAVAVLAGDSATLLDYQDVGVLLLMRRFGLGMVEVPVDMHPRCNGISRLFHSWLAVLRYMVATTVICIAGLERPRLRGSRPRVTA